MKRQSIWAEMLSLPVEHPRHQQLRNELWMVGQWFESHYYLSILTGENWLDFRDFDFVHQALVDYVTINISAASGKFLAACRQPTDVAHAYLKYQVARKEGWAETTKWSKAERLMILLIEHPDWTDEQFIKALKTTPKQLQRLNCFFQVARQDAKRRAVK
jgi:hypothetical protein